MNPVQRLELFLTGKTFVGYRKLSPTWKEAQPFYAFRCPTHGIVEDYLHGFEGYEYLNCPLCPIKSIHPDLVEIVVQEALDG